MLLHKSEKPKRPKLVLAGWAKRRLDILERDAEDLKKFIKKTPGLRKAFSEGQRLTRVEGPPRSPYDWGMILGRGELLARLAESEGYRPKQRLRRLARLFVSLMAQRKYRKAILLEAIRELWH